MEIRRMDWDSAFFKEEVFAVTLSLKDALYSVGELKRSLREAGASLAYIFLQEPCDTLQQDLTLQGAVLYDEKITYSKSVPVANGNQPEDIVAYNGKVTDELLDLALLAGHESRFRKDARLLPSFEPLYKLWIENSVNGTIADKVFIYTVDNHIAGLVTCKIKDQTGHIGLIATAARWQGRGIGSHLLMSTDSYYVGNNVETSTVVTQLTNHQACRFYEKAGFSVYRKEYVYHWWFK